MPELIELNTGRKKRRSEAGYNEMFANLPICRVEEDTLTEEQKALSGVPEPDSAERSRGDVD